MCFSMRVIMMFSFPCCLRIWVDLNVSFAAPQDCSVYMSYADYKWFFVVQQTGRWLPGCHSSSMSSHTVLGLGYLPCGRASRITVAQKALWPNHAGSILHFPHRPFTHFWGLPTSEGTSAHLAHALLLLSSVKEWVCKVGIYPHQVNFSKIYILVVSLWSSAIIPNETPWSCIVGNKALVHITTISVVLRESVVLVPGPVDEISRTGKCLSTKSFPLRKGVCLAGITVVSM